MLINPSFFWYQWGLFNELTTKYRVLLKGRQIGATYGLMQLYCQIQWSEQRYKQALWIDVTDKKYSQYAERYAVRDYFKYYGISDEDYKLRLHGAKELRIKDTLLDFGSMESPDAIDGNSYELIIINEAGIIHKKPQIFEEKVLPTMLNNPNAVCIIAGVPKGAGGLYEQQWKKVLNPNEKNWSGFQVTSYDRPDWTKKQVDEVALEIPSHLRQQEIYANFINSESQIFKNEWIKFHSDYKKYNTRYMYIDLAISQKDSADFMGIAIMEQRGDSIYYIDVLELKTTFNKQLQVINQLAKQYEVDKVGVESNGYQLAMVQELIRTTKLNVKAIPSRQKKEERAVNLALRMEQGLVYLNENIKGNILDQLTSFPDVKLL